MKTNFIILATQRTGSTLLVTLLDSHPEIRCYGEMFLDPPASEMHYWSWLKRHAYVRATSRLFVKSAYLSYIRFLSRMNRNVPVIGFKLMYDQADRHPALLAMIRSKWRVIHLIRRNVVKTYLSSVIAIKRKDWSSKKVLAPIKVRVKPDEMLSDMRKISNDRERYSKAFDRNRYMEIYYEDLCGCRSFEETLRFIGVQKGYELKSDLVKVNSNSLVDLVENYEEMKEALVNTEYAHMIGDDNMKCAPE